MAASTPPTSLEVRDQIIALANQPELIQDYLSRVLPFLLGPVISDFTPQKGYAGTLVEIHGGNFAAARHDNDVTVGGRPAMVVEAAPNLLKVITDPAMHTGPVKVTIGGHSATGPVDFKVLPYPDSRVELDGPPILFAGKGQGDPGKVPATGTMRILAVLVNPTDRVPADPAGARNNVVGAWANVHTYYDQASYGRLNVAVDVTANWHTITGAFADYVDTGIQNIRTAALDRLEAEAAQTAVNEGFNLDNYALMAVILNLNGTFIRAWGGRSKQNFTFNDGGATNINITVNHDLNLLDIQESADWGRFAHETGHSLVSVPAGVSNSPGAATLGEDVYSSDLIDPTVATVQNFEIMGNHDSHPLFSGFFLEELGYYNSVNIMNLQWDRNAFSQEFDVVAHGLTENNAGGRFHLLKIKVADGLFYYVQVRQRPPGGSAQIYDGQIPLDGATHDGGVIVIKVLTDASNINQQLRFLTLLHDPHVLKQGDVATDPARALTITVVNDNVATNPLVCRVRVSWAQGIADDPNGAFDLRLDPWDANYQTPDIWVDRMPFGVFDQPLDAQGRPQGNGDKPRPKEINHFFTRIHCDGTVGATNVRVTFYVVDPPGVGDNGNWAPLITKVVPNIAAGGFVDVNVNWVPVVGEHTCLKVYAEQQLGEITGGNNSAQENIFDFEAPASSVPDPVQLPVAVRNPLKRRTLVFLGVKGVSTGFIVHFPHAWVWLDALAERKLLLTVIPTLDYNAYREMKVPAAPVRVAGDIPRSYDELIPPGVPPGSRMFAIGGILARVTPKRRVKVDLAEDRERSKSTTVALRGVLTPALASEKLRIDLIGPDGERVADVVTDTAGHFATVFDLERKPSVDGHPDRQPPQKFVPGVYKAQALVINSPHAAQTESTVVYVTK
jgi:hypothetical protein